MGERDIYIAIMRAAARGEGLRLSAADCFDLSGDAAIMTVATNNLTLKEAHSICQDGSKTWADINPRRQREAGGWFCDHTEAQRRDLENSDV